MADPASTNGHRKPSREGARRHRRRRQLRLRPRPGRPPLPRRQGRRVRPRPHARRPRRLPHLGHRVLGRVRRRRRKGRPRPRRGDLPRPEQHGEVLRRAQAERPRPPRHDPRRHRQVPEQGDHEGARRDGRRRPRSSGDGYGRGRQLPAGRLGGGDQVVRRAGAVGGLRVRELRAGVHRPRAVLAAAVRGEGAADRRRRHQVAGRRHDRPPPAHAPLPRARRSPRAHPPAERRRQHRLPEHARARAARVEEDLQDERRHVAARLRHRRPQRPHRPVRLRRVARRPQVGLHPHGGALVRRRAAQHRAEARGRRLAELRRDRHRRGALREAGPRQRPGGRAGVAVGVLHEVAAGAAPRRPVP